MSNKVRVTGRLIAAARALTGVSQENFAAAAQVPVDALRLMESSGSAWIEGRADIAALKRALDHFGVVVIDEADGAGAGVRLKFTRSDVRQIVRLEDEGGMVGSDDAP